MKYFLMTLVTALMLAGPPKISSIETRGNQVHLYDEGGRKYKTLTTSVIGQVQAYSAEIFITEKHGWIYIFDSEGQKLRTLSASYVGTVLSCVNNTFTSRKGSMVYIWDKNGNKIHSRSVKQ